LLLIISNGYNEIHNKNSSHSVLHIGYKEKDIEQTVNTNFLGLQTDNHIHWKTHAAQMIPQSSAAHYAVSQQSISVTLAFGYQFTVHNFTPWNNLLE
jgi:hypothetical protein